MTPSNERHGNQTKARGNDGRTKRALLFHLMSHIKFISMGGFLLRNQGTCQSQDKNVISILFAKSFECFILHFDTSQLQRSSSIYDEQNQLVTCPERGRASERAREKTACCMRLEFEM